MSDDVIHSWRITTAHGAIFHIQEPDRGSARLYALECLDEGDWIASVNHDRQCSCRRLAP